MIIRQSIYRSIRGPMLILLAIPLLFGAAITAEMAVTAAKNYVRATELERLDAAGNQVIDGVHELVLERLRTNNALQAAGPADQAALAQIAQHRKAAEQALAAGIAGLQRLDFRGKARLLAGYGEMHRTIADYRQQADTAIGQPKADRPPALLKDYYPAMRRFVNTAQELWIGALHEAMDEDPQVADFNMLKKLGWIGREQSGLVRSKIAGQISAGKPLPPEKVKEITGHLAQVDLVWRLLGEQIADVKEPPAITAAIEKTRQDNIGTYRKLVLDMMAASAAGKPYPVTVNQWIKTTSPLLDTFLGIKAAATAAGRAYVEQKASDAWWAMVEDLLLLVVAVGAGGLCVLFMERRVVRPVITLTAVVRRVAEGDKSVEVAETARRDEIGEMQRATRVFLDTALEHERLQLERERLRVEQEAEREAARAAADAARAELLRVDTLGVDELRDE